MGPWGCICASAAPITFGIARKKKDVSILFRENILIFYNALAPITFGIAYNGVSILFLGNVLIFYNVVSSTGFNSKIFKLNIWLRF